MQIELQARGFDLTPGLNDYVVNRLTKTLSRMRDEIGKVTVRISDDNGPRHGIDKRCLVHVTLHGRKDVVVQEINDDMYAAIGHAVIRAARSVKRLLRYRHQHRSVDASESIQTSTSD